ncbi:MAG: hypothetical protein ACAI25_01640 [Planctomycetota bacterium]
MKLLQIAAVAACLVAPAVLRADDKKSEYADGEEGLKKLVTDMMDAAKAKDKDKLDKLAASLVLADPDAYFKKLFAEKGAPVAEGYTKHKDEIAKELPKLFNQAVEKNRTAIKIIKAEGGEATGAQKSATEAMKEKVTLWTVGLGEEGKGAGLKLWSFAYVDGAWKFIGKLRELGGRGGEKSGDAPAPKEPKEK